MQIRNHKNIDAEQLLALYNDAGWSAYTQDPGKLQRALQNSLTVISAWEGARLVGLARAIGDAETILYIQDILVLRSQRRQGIGAELLRVLLAQFPEVRQTVLLTDDSTATRSFYTALGFRSCDSGKLVAFAKLTNA